MSLKAGRVGVNPADVDPIDGHISPSSVDSYTKAQSDAKFSTKDELRIAINDIDLLMGSKLTSVYGVMGENGAKNLLPLTLTNIKNLNPTRTWNGNSSDHNGITFTVNTDANGNVTSISESGTATGFAFLRLASVSSFSGSFILNKGISGNKYIYIQNETTSTEIAKTTGGDTSVSLTATNDNVNAIIAINPSQTGTDTFYPMLRLASDPDDTYVPYAMTNRELTINKLDISTLKTITADAADFSAFKTAIANL